MATDGRASHQTDHSPPAPAVTVESLGQLVPGPAAAGMPSLRSNNNLDMCLFEGRLHLAWRTAPNHFAGRAARIVVSSIPYKGSTTDPVRGTWRHETTLSRGADLREPRFAAGDGELHLFYMELGTDPRRFQPRRTWRTDTDGRRWSEPVVAIDDPIVPWRVRRLAGRWVMSTYRGAERMYGPLPADPVVELRFSSDLREWSPPMPIHTGGIEAELVQLADGGFVGVTRNEGPSRSGSDVLTGRDLESLETSPVPRKLDSPNLFLWQGEPWLVARRSLAFGGRYGLAPASLPGALTIRMNQLAWWMTRKRSALYRIDPALRSVEWVVDLPSRGDTSFAGVVEEPDGSLLVADYASARTTGDPIWLRGQLGPTVIELFRLRRADRASDAPPEVARPPSRHNRG
jgi:hypothetical protein